MPYQLDDTIVAIASAAGGADRGIVRISGANACQLLGQFVTFPDANWLSPEGAARVATGFVTLSEHAVPLEVVVYWWPNRRSYTCQSVAEIHSPGSQPLLAAIVRRACQVGGRLAEPGEFTLRAFLAGRLDLTQAEAVLGVIDARGQSDLQAALEQLAGGLARPLAAARESLLDLQSHLEAGLDFVEEDIEFITPALLAAQLESVEAIVNAALDQLAKRAVADDAVKIVLMGWPNVGKSSLFNALAGGTTPSLVADASGTTRDYLTAPIELGELRATLIDTAGVEVVENESAAGGIATTAQRFTTEQAERADVRVLCLDATRSLNAWERQQLAAEVGPRIVVWTKCDRAVPPEDISAIATSATSGAGLIELRRELSHLCRDVVHAAENSVAITADRCHDSLRAATSAIALAHELCIAGEGEELVAAELHVAIHELGRVAGVVYTDDILDRIFSRFCIGK